MTDQYNIVELAARNLVAGQLSSYFPNPDETVTQSDDTHLDRGHDYFAIFYPGSFPTTIPGDQSLVVVSWEILLDIMVRFNSTEAIAWRAFKELRWEVINLFNFRKIGRTLNGTSGIKYVTLSSEERPRYIPMDPKNEYSDAAFIAQAMSLTVTQFINKS